MDDPDGSPRLRRQLTKDFSAIVDEVVGSNDLQEVFDERQWPPSVIAQLKTNLLHDEDFVRRLHSSYANVFDRATQLDEHSNVKPQVTGEDVAALLQKPTLKKLVPLLLTVVLPAFVLPLSILPDSTPLQLFAVVALAAMLYYLPPIDDAVRRALPPALSQRRAWGRHRWWLQGGFTRLRWDWKTTIRNDVVLPEVLARVNAGAHRVFSHDLRIHHTRATMSLPATSFLIATDAVDRLGRELSRTSSGAIALAGRRGVGKTTLLQALAGGVLPRVDLGNRLTVLVPAPARYQLREFVLHLHTVIARAVLDHVGNPRVVHTTATQDRWTHHYKSAGRKTTCRELSWYFTRATSWLTLTAALAAMLWQHDVRDLAQAYVAEVTELVNLDFAPPTPSSFEQVRPTFAILVLTGGILAAGWCLLRMAAVPLRQLGVRARRRVLTWGDRLAAKWRSSSSYWLCWRWLRLQTAPVLPRQWRPRVLDEPSRAPATLTGIERGRRLRQLDRPVQALASLATEQLRRIRFLQTHTSGWSGKVDGPKTLGVTVTRSIAHAEQPLTQPEVVDQLRKFLHRAATTLIRAGEINGIAVAIDELDKFADPAQAHEFVNEIKTVFGVDNCVFLVSVSDDALASFERRGIPVRDALDSAFTAMIAVEPFTLAEAHQWLDRHVIGLPSPFTCLCYCLSAGVPRELARSMATLVDLYEDHDEEQFDRAEKGLPFSGQAYRQLTEVTRTIVAADVAACCALLLTPPRNSPQAAQSPRSSSRSTPSGSSPTRTTNSSRNGSILSPRRSATAPVTRSMRVWSNSATRWLRSATSPPQPSKFSTRIWMRRYCSGCVRDRMACLRPSRGPGVISLWNRC
ncbi:MAG TPA: hypothetical protein VGP24_12825 [Glaciihabitans sp.]|jgi:hypothetical protein|nr:hypothetical protein [Glaciihabitans sp.]